jgi:hypothetical protein
MRASLVLGGALLVVLGFSQASSAATVNTVQGEVLVNSGNGFKPIAGTLGDLKPGSQVMVRPGGSATITYASNCSVRVPSGVWAVQGAAPCVAGTDTIDFTARMNQGAPPPADGGQEAPPPADGGIGTTTLVVGGLVVAGAVAAAVLLSQNSSSASP